MNNKDLIIRDKLQKDKEISDKADKIFNNLKEKFKLENNEGRKVIKISLKSFIAIATSFVIILFLGVGLYTNKLKENNSTEAIKPNETETKQAFKYALKSNSLEDFDLRFLQLENEKVNKIYSPLSIKYTLGMLNEGTEGTSKEQISNLIGEYKSNKYINSENMSFANALFIRDTYKESVKENFVNNLKTKYNADVVYDSFNSAEKINSWVSDKTLDLINNMLNDSEVSELNYALINALAIDMDWENKFLEPINAQTEYTHENYRWMAPLQLLSNEFEGVKNKISGMGIIASINNYDIVNTLGEENIRKTVGDEFRKYLNEDPDGNAAYYLEGKDVETAVKDYLDEYIEEINKNYKSVDRNTDFSIYEDKNVKAFAKDLKEYNGTTLQYVAIMPEEDLNSYINNITAEDINKVINNLKELKSENFKEGVITQIVGYIPKFKFDYDLNLIEDLNDMGVKDVFAKDKANLKGITDDDEAYIGKAVHKANIEFTQEGIKASAATLGGGMGAGSMFDYIYDVPVEEITLNFDKPYMFIIRDKVTGEVWFVGTVYEPLSLKEEPEAENVYELIGSYSDFLKNILKEEKENEENDNYIEPTEEIGFVSGADAMPEMLRYKGDYKANYYYRLVGLKNNNNGTYTANVEFHSPIFESEEKHNSLVRNGWGEIEGDIYNFSNEDNENNRGYGYIYNDNNVYTIEKQEIGYGFYHEIGGVIKTIETSTGSFEKTLNEDVIVEEFPSGGKYKLKGYAKTLTDSFISRNMITFEYSEENGEIYLLRDVR